MPKNYIPWDILVFVSKYAVLADVPVFVCQSNEWTENGN